MTTLDNYLRKIYWKVFYFGRGYKVAEYYFSQSGEDHILSKVFENKLSQNKSGFYVDIGAYHPFEFSNTFYFYMRGWSGINVDPTPGSMKLFNRLRERDQNLEMGISGKGGGYEMTFYDFGNSTMSSFDLDWIVKNGLNTDLCRQIRIKTYTLDKLLDQYLPAQQEIDFLSIDAEGLTQEIYESINWDKYRPRVLVIEMEGRFMSDIRHEIEYFRMLGYDVIAKTTLNGPTGTVVLIDSSGNNLREL